MTTEPMTVSITHEGKTVTTTSDVIERIAANYRSLETVQVDAAQLSIAIRAVLPHAAKEGTSDRIRFTIGGGMFVSATDRSTAGVARIHPMYLPDYDGAVWTFDLLTRDANILATLFAPEKDGPAVCVELRVRFNEVTAVDVSGLYPGRTVELPRIGGDKYYGDVTKIITGIIDRGPRRDHTQPLIVSPKQWSKFVKTATVYGRTIQTDHRYQPLLITINHGAFVGVLTDGSYEFSSAEYTNELTGWADQLARLSDLHTNLTDTEQDAA